MLSVGKEAARTIFKVFAMTQQGFEPPTSQTQTYYATESDKNFFQIFRFSPLVETVNVKFIFSE